MYPNNNNNNNPPFQSIPPPPGLQFQVPPPPTTLAAPPTQMYGANVVQGQAGPAQDYGNHDYERQGYTNQDDTYYSSAAPVMMAMGLPPPPTFGTPTRTLPPPAVSASPASDSEIPMNWGIPICETGQPQQHALPPHPSLAFGQQTGDPGANSSQRQYRQQLPRNATRDQHDTGFGFTSGAQSQEQGRAAYNMPEPSRQTRVPVANQHHQSQQQQLKQPIMLGPPASRGSKGKEEEVQVDEVVGIQRTESPLERPHAPSPGLVLASTPIMNPMTKNEHEPEVVLPPAPELKGDEIVANVQQLCGDRGLVFARGDGLVEYGPVGERIRQKLLDAWNVRFVQQQENVYEISGSSLLSEETLKTTGHLDTTAAPLSECSECHAYHRTDHLIARACHGEVYEGSTLDQLQKKITNAQIACPACGGALEDAVDFHTLFETALGPSPHNIATSAGRVKKEKPDPTLYKAPPHSIQQQMQTLKDPLAELEKGILGKREPSSEPVTNNEDATDIDNTENNKDEQEEIVKETSVDTTSSADTLDTQSTAPQEIPEEIPETTLEHETEKEQENEESVALADDIDDVAVVLSKAPPFFLRSHVTQNIYLNYQRIADTMQPTLPFGVAHVGKTWRNVIHPDDFLFNLREFTQVAVALFFAPTDLQPKLYNWDALKSQEITLITKADQYMKKRGTRCTVDMALKRHWLPDTYMAYYVGLEAAFMDQLGLADHCRFRETLECQLSHNSKSGFALEISLPNSSSDSYVTLASNSYRADNDLQHLESNPNATQSPSRPHALEAVGGLDRLLYAILLHSYRRDNSRAWKWLQLPISLAPWIAVVTPTSDTETLNAMAFDYYRSLKQQGWDVILWPPNNSSIATRYARADEVGIPFVITVDDKTKEYGLAGIRHRDSKTQESRALYDVSAVFANAMGM